MLDRWMYGDGANDVHHDVFRLFNIPFGCRLIGYYTFGLWPYQPTVKQVYCRLVAWFPKLEEWRWCGVFVVSSKDRWYFIDHHHRHDDEMHEKSLNWHVINVNDWQIYQTGPLGVVLMARRQRWPMDLPSVRQKDAWLSGRTDRQTDEGIRRWYKY